MTVKLTLKEQQVHNALKVTLTSFLKSNNARVQNMVKVLGSKSIGLLVEILKTDTTVTNLNLSCCDIDDAGAKDLADALKTNSTLISLNLENNNIGDEGTKALAKALETNKALQQLSYFQFDLKSYFIFTSATGCTAGS